MCEFLARLDFLVTFLSMKKVTKKKGLSSHLRPLNQPQEIEYSNSVISPEPINRAYRRDMCFL